MGFDGKTPEDVRLWHTYLHWARSAVRVGKEPDPRVMVDDPSNRVAKNIAEALQAVVFCSFTLEYRMKRVMTDLGVPIPKRETLGPLFGQFWDRLTAVDRKDGAGKCAPPAGWEDCKKVLVSLIEVRNAIAHANYEKTLRLVHGTSDTSVWARQFYNALVDAIMFINIGTGYDTRPFEEMVNYFRPLKA